MEETMTKTPDLARPIQVRIGGVWRPATASRLLGRFPEPVKTILTWQGNDGACSCEPCDLGPGDVRNVDEKGDETMTPDIDAMLAEADQPKRYAERDVDPYLNLYMRHVGAMTTEELHSKGAIAAELAWRDYVILRLRAELDAKMADVMRANRIAEAGYQLSTYAASIHWDGSRNTKEWLFGDEDGDGLEGLIMKVQELYSTRAAAVAAAASLRVGGEKGEAES